MSEQDEIDYLRERAASERRIAEACACNIAAIRHFELAESYEARIRALREQAPFAPSLDLPRIPT